MNQYMSCMEHGVIDILYGFNGQIQRVGKSPLLHIESTTLKGGELAAGAATVGVQA